MKILVWSHSHALRSSTLSTCLETDTLSTKKHQNKKQINIKRKRKTRQRNEKFTISKMSLRNVS